MLLVDDAEQFDDADQAIAGLLGARTDDLKVVAAGRSDDLRSLYSHWTRTVRKSRAGVLLQPNIDYDGELLGVTLPRRSPVAMTVGRGYLAAGGTVDLLQAAGPNAGGVGAAPAGPGAFVDREGVEPGPQLVELGLLRQDAIGVVQHEVVEAARSAVRREDPPDDVLALRGAARRLRVGRQPRHRP